MFAGDRLVDPACSRRLARTWQVPLLELPQAQFLLMSATLGDVSTIAADLARRTGRAVAEITGVERPVPRWSSISKNPPAS